MKRLHKALKVLLWPHPKNIFDIGACDGASTLEYATVFPHAKYWLFEPLPRNVNKIGQSLKNTKINYKVYPFALSDQKKVATFYVSAGDPENKERDIKAKLEKGNKSSSLLKPKKEKPEILRWLEFPEKIFVQTETLDSFCESRNISSIDYLHLDVQGAEMKVLKGGSKMLPKIKAIWTEVAFERTYETQPLEYEVTKWMKSHYFSKVFQVNYGPEADALYVNLRGWRNRLRLLILKIVLRIENLRPSK